MTNCYKGWTCQGSLIWHQRDITRGQGPIRALVLFTLQRNLCKIHRGKPVQVDRLVSYPLVFFTSKIKIAYIAGCRWLGKQEVLSAALLRLLRRVQETPRHRPRRAAVQLICLNLKPVNSLLKLWKNKHINPICCWWLIWPLQ